jgi:diguanylate cyclase (GGDEF)-like protein
VRECVPLNGELDLTTGLPGQGVIFEHGNDVLGGLSNGQKAAVLLLDIDGFRMLNNGFGHAAGDAVLSQLATRLTDTVRDGDLVVRVGADEFAVLCGRISTTDEAAALGRRLLGVFATPFKVLEQQVSLGARVGIAVTGPTDRTLLDLVRDADLAMTHTQQSHTRWALFRPEMRDAPRRYLETASDLRNARGRRELRLEYQPIVSLPGGDLPILEALVRWAHPQRGLVPPNEFIPVAEQAGLITDIGEWVLDEALRAACRWSDLVGAASPCVAVNVSAQQLADPDFVYKVTRSIAEAELSPERLILEVTESAVMENVEAAVESLRVLTGLGTRIALDDFGAGASSLSQLRQLRWVDLLKIDKSFIDGVTASAEDEAIVRAVIELARALEMAVVAEGIETEEQAALMVELGCDYAQGYYFGRALRPTAADTRITAAAHSQRPV